MNDFVFYRDDENNICSGGYIINNMLKKLDMPIVYSNKDPLQSGGGLSAMLGELAVPAGLVLMQQYAAAEKFSSPSATSVVEEDLYSKLLKLVKVHKSKTKKKKNKRKNKTRKKKVK